MRNWVHGCFAQGFHYHFLCNSPDSSFYTVFPIIGYSLCWLHGGCFGIWSIVVNQVDFIMIKQIIWSRANIMTKKFTYFSWYYYLHQIISPLLLYNKTAQHPKENSVARKDQKMFGSLIRNQVSDKSDHIYVLKYVCPYTYMYKYILTLGYNLVK